MGPNPVRCRGCDLLARARNLDDNITVDKDSEGSFSTQLTYQSSTEFQWRLSRAPWRAAGGRKVEGLDKRPGEEALFDRCSADTLPCAQLRRSLGIVSIDDGVVGAAPTC